MVYELLKKESGSLEYYAKGKELNRVSEEYLGYVSKAEAGGFVYVRDAFESESGRALEFSVSDILRAENVEQLINPEGQSRPLVRIWVKKGALGKKVHFFKVGG